MKAARRGLSRRRRSPCCPWWVTSANRARSPGANSAALLPRLPDHLARMSLFALNTGVRDDVVCSLRWDWEIKVPELGISVFEVPREHVKGRKRTRVVICNSVAQSVIEAVRGQHKEFVFVYRRERVKNTDKARRDALPRHRDHEQHRLAAGPQARPAWATCTCTTCATPWACACGRRACLRARSPTSCGTAP